MSRKRTVKEVGVGRVILLGSQNLNGVPVNPKSEFFIDTNRIFGIYHTGENINVVQQKELVVNWSSIDGSFPQVTNKNVVSSAVQVSPSKQPLKGRTSAFFQLSNLEHTLPVGNYKVEIRDVSIEGSEPFATSNFKIVERKGTYLGYRYNKVSIENPVLKFNGHTREIFGVHHLSEEEKSHVSEYEGSRSKENGNRARWLKIEGSGEDSVLFQCPLEFPEPNDSVRFSLPKSGQELFSPGSYFCSVVLGGREVSRVKFEILEPKPEIFLGTKFSDFFMDILDNRVVFPSSTSTIRGVYKFCRTIDHEKNVAGVRWIFLRPFGSKKPLETPKIIEQRPIPSEKNFDMIVFKLELAVLDPGLFCCEIYLNQKYLQKRRYFHYKPRMDVSLLPTYHQEEEEEEQEGEEESVNDDGVVRPTSDENVFYFRSKVKEIKGELRTNANFLKKDAQVKVLWMKDEKESNENSLISTTIVHISQKKDGDEYFSNFGFFAGFDSYLENGDYKIQLYVNNEMVHLQRFKVVNENEYKERLRKIML